MLSYDDWFMNWENELVYRFCLTRDILHFDYNEYEEEFNSYAFKMYEEHESGKVETDHLIERAKDE